MTDEFLPGEKDHGHNYIMMVCLNDDCKHEELRFKSTKKCRKCGGRLIASAIKDAPEQICFIGDCDVRALQQCITCEQYYCMKHHGPKHVCTRCNSPYRMWPPLIINEIRKLKR